MVNPFSFFYGAAVFIFVVMWAALMFIWDLPFWISWLGASSIVAFILCGFDKSAARRDALRVPERVLLVVALLGGSLGLLPGMNIFHHKTRKIGFQLLVLLVLIVQLIALRYFTSV